MALVSYEPFSLMGQLRREVNRLSDKRLAREGQESSPTFDWAPLIDIVEGNDRYVICADIPGVDPSQINITFENDVLTLRGQRPTEKQGDSTIIRRTERPMGDFYRRFVMPDSVDGEGVSAEGKNGVLQIVVPKRPQAQARRIQVNAQTETAN